MLRACDHHLASELWILQALHVRWVVVLSTTDTCDLRCTMYASAAPRTSRCRFREAVYLGIWRVASWKQCHAHDH